MRRTTLIAGTAGILSIAAAATLRFVVVPAQAQLPADTDTTRNYAGVIDVMLDAEALANADLANAIVRGVPVSIQRDTTVTEVVDGNATVAETSVVTAPDGSVVLGSEVTYLVDRRTMLSADQRSGLVIGWPIDTEARDYTGWSSDLQAEVPLTYVGTEDFQGIDAFVFTADVQGRIVDEATLANFPAALPKFAIPLVASALDLDPQVAEGLPGLLAALPDQVDLGYFLDSETTYWVDPTTGMVLDLDRTESRQVAFDVEGVPATPIANVFSWTYSGTEESVAATVADAESAGSQLSLFGTTLPITLAVLGLALLGIGLASARRSGKAEQVLDLTAESDKQVAAGV